MIDFDKEFGHWYDEAFGANSEKPLHHRLKKHHDNFFKIQAPICKFNVHIWVDENQKIIYENICKTCLKTYTEEEIIDLKQYLVLKRLKG